MTKGTTSEPSVEGGKQQGNAFIQFYRYVFGVGHERNVGGTERAIRYALGGLFVLAGAGIVAVPIVRSVLTNAVLSLVLIVNGLYLIYEAQVQYCPLNHTIGRSTYPGE